MDYTGSITAGNEHGLRGQDDMSSESSKTFGSSLGRKIQGSSGLFVKKNPGSPGRLGRASGLSESLSKLRGKGALA